MNNKVLVMVYVPMLEKEFDIYIPTVKKIGTIKKLIIKIVTENSNGIFIDDNAKYLYDKITGEVYDDNQFVRDSSLENGSKIKLY